jgi:signal transduction histidine kinase
MSTDSPGAAPIVQFNHDQVRFLRVMGHELRSPLNSIQATAEMMANGIYGELQPPQSKATQRILRNSYRLLELINDVMMYIRAQANALERNSVPVSLKDLLHDQISQHQELAAAKGLVIEMHVQPGMVETVQNDPDQIVFIVNELLKNAISFTESGRIHVNVSDAEPDQWMLLVVDTGHGIEPDKIQLAFTPFWRGAGAKQIAPDGNGLGLAIVYELVRLMNGHIDLESQAGKGTTIKVTLPNVVPANLDTSIITPPGAFDPST